MGNITAYKVGSGTTGLPMSRESHVVTVDAKTLLSNFSAGGGVTTDTIAIMDIPANTLLEVLHIEVVEADISLGAGARIDVGDSSSATRFVSNASTLTNGTDLTIALIPYLYTAADQLRVKITGGTIATTGGLRFVLRLTDTTRLAKATARTYTN